MCSIERPTIGIVSARLMPSTNSDKGRHELHRIIAPPAGHLDMRRSINIFKLWTHTLGRQCNTKLEARHIVSKVSTHWPSKILCLPMHRQVIRVTLPAFVICLYTDDPLYSEHLHLTALGKSMQTMPQIFVT